ncbi:hypothetical protein [Streptomyces amakusaensis]|uniref:Uncharacterized protein n=1 Tax=Streptomyces amakusaensis TaxID=67271 RepID=A0ABW0APJ3_9ACTN
MALLHIDQVLGDHPFAEIGEPSLAVADKRRALLAVAGTHTHHFAGGAPVGVYDTGDLVCQTLLRSRYRVHALAFHPTLPLLATGTGRYDGGYFFDGELLLLNLETGESVSAIEHESGRQVLELEWQNETDLHLLMAPPDDWQDKEAHTHGHTAVVNRPDWNAVDPHSLTGRDLAGPRVAAPRGRRPTSPPPGHGTRGQLGSAPPCPRGRTALRRQDPVLRRRA